MNLSWDRDDWSVKECDPKADWEAFQKNPHSFAADLIRELVEAPADCDVVQLADYRRGVQP